MATTINWKHTYSPRIQIGSVVFLLPTPLTQINESYTRDTRTTKVPLQSGVLLSRSSRGPLTLSFAGTISARTLEEALVYKRMLQQYLIENELPFTFYKYYSDDGNKIWYENVVCTNLGFVGSPKNPFNGMLNYTRTFLVPSGIEREYIAATEARAYNLVRYNDDENYIEPAGPSDANDPSYTSPTPSESQPESPSIPDEQEGIWETPSDPTPIMRSYIYGPIIIRLNSGGAFIVKNSDGEIVAKISDDGSIQTIGMVETVESITVE